MGERGLYSRKERFGGVKLIFSFIKKIIKTESLGTECGALRLSVFGAPNNFKKLADAFVIS